jgi:hypothetical protein
MELYILIENGAYAESNGIFYGEKGQLLKKTGSELYKILSPKPGQTTDDFYVGDEKIRKI